MSDEIKPRNDFITTYVDLEVLRTDTDAYLTALLELKETLIVGGVMKSQQLELLSINAKIDALRVYKERLEELTKQWAKSIAAIGKTYNRRDYILFNELIIKQKSVKEVPYAESTCYNFLTDFNKAINKIQSSPKYIKRTSN